MRLSTFSVFFVIIFAAFGLLSAPAASQVPSSTTQIVQMQISIPDENFLDRWAKEYSDSETWPALIQDVKMTLEGLTKLHPERLPEGCPIAPRHNFDFKHNTYRILFLSQANKPDGELINFLISPDGEPYSNRLPGIHTLYDVFLQVDDPGSLSSVYSSKEAKSPVEEKLPAFFKQLDLSGLAKLVSGPEARQHHLYVQVATVKLPYERSTVSVHDEASVPPRLDRSKLSKASLDLKESLVVRAAGGSACATRMATCLDHAVRFELATMPGPEAAKDCDKPDWSPYTVPGTDDCQRFILGAVPSDNCYKEISEDARTRCLATLRIHDIYQAVATKDPLCMQAGPPDFTAASHVEDVFVSLATGNPVKAKADTSYDNVPQEHWSLGLTAAFIANPSRDVRYKLDSGKISANPVSGTLSMATLNFHPLGYNPRASSQSFGERFRVLGGVTVTPEFGLGVGVGYGIVRGLSLNIGVAWLRVDTKRKGDGVGQVPSNLAHPFHNGITRVLFFGFGYSL